MQIGDVKINVKDMKKGPMVFGDSIDSSFHMVFGESIDSLFQKFVMTNDHEACSINSKDKYSQPWWCPPGLTHTQKEGCSACVDYNRRSRKMRS